MPNYRFEDIGNEIINGKWGKYGSSVDLHSYMQSASHEVLAVSLLVGIAKQLGKLNDVALRQLDVLSKIERNTRKKRRRKPGN
jgi:hypothetical protein